VLNIVQKLLGGWNEEFEERFSLRSNASHVFKCGHFKVLVLEGRGTGAANQRVMLLWIPLPRFEKKTAIRREGLKVQRRERTEPHIWWHGVLWALASLKVWTNDSKVNMTIIM
jgi:hypothetical protein